MIRVCIPYYNEFEAVKPGLQEIKDDPEFEVVPCRGTYIGNNRNSCIVKVATDLKKPDIVDKDFLFIDSDISFTKAHIERACAISKEFPVVFLPYRTHADQKVYQCGTWGVSPGLIKERVSITSSGLHKVDWCGAGFLFVKNQVMKDIEFPFFRSYVYEEGDRATQIGEDIGFCVQLAKHNIPIVADFSNPVGHRVREHARIFKEQEV